MEVALILNTKPISEELQKRFGTIYPLMLPIEEGTIEDYLLEQYASSDYIFIACNQEQAEEKEIKLRKRAGTVYELYLDDLESDTLLNVVSLSLQRIADFLMEDYTITINYGDTIVQDMHLIEEMDFIVTGKKEETSSWTQVQREEKNLIFSNNGDSNKTHNGHKNKEGKEVVAGVFKFQSASLLLKACQEVGNEERLSNLSDSLSLYSAMRYYDQFFLPVSLKLVDTWLDLGHELEYLETKKMVQARFFNTIEIDDQRGILTKRSEEKKKLVNEIQWYLKMPKVLQYLTPRIYDYSLDPMKPEVSMEYYPYETLHTLYIYANLEIPIWEKIIDKLLFVREEMSNYSENYALKLEEQDIFDIYYKKTVERVSTLREDPKFSPFYDQTPVINGTEYPPLMDVMGKLEEILKRNGLFKTKTAQVIHGDFCLSNILLDRESNLIKLIDPRGQFGSLDIYGDEFYDIAKILHSFEGSYDHIITDSFELIEATDSSYTYHFEKSELQESISKLVNQKVEEHYDIQQIRLIEGLLFLSMIPLHKDYPKRQKIMFGQAMKLLKPYFEETVKVEENFNISSVQK